MKATDILIVEHRIISKVLQCLERFARSIKEDREIDTDTAAEFLDFFKNFADGCHHAKEEDRLFPLMEQFGFPQENGPTGVMNMEHLAGRRLIKRMTDAVYLASVGDTLGFEAFYENSIDFIQLLSQHIDKENSVLFPMANMTFNKETQTCLLNEFRDIEEAAGGERQTMYTALAKKLCAQFDIDWTKEDEMFCQIFRPTPRRVDAVGLSR